MRAELLYESAVDELKKKLPSLRKIDYSTIDNLMQRISKRYKITGKKLHDLFVSKYGHTPDTWIKKYKEKLGEEGVAEGTQGLQNFANEVWQSLPNRAVSESQLNEIDPGLIANLAATFPTLAKIVVNSAVKKAMKEKEETTYMVNVLKKRANDEPVSPNENSAAHDQFKDLVFYGLATAAATIAAGPVAGAGVALAAVYKKELLDLIKKQGYEVLIHLLKGKGIDIISLLINKFVAKHVLPFHNNNQGVAEGWQKVNKSDKTAGMSKKAVSAYRRENPGSKLKTAVTTKPSKLKPGSKAAKRRKSFCARMGGNKGPMKKPNGKPSPKALALRRWNCESIEELQELVMLAEQKVAEAKNLKQQAAIAISKKKGMNEGVVVQFPNKQQPTKPNASPLQKKKQVTQRTTSQNVVSIAKKPAGITWKKLPKDVLKLANDWFWADMDDGGSASALDPKGYGSGTRNQLQFITAQLQQRGWNIDDDDKFDNVLLTNKAGQSVLLPRDDAYDFKGWAAGTNSHLRESVEGKDDVQRIKDFINWSLKTLNIEKPYPKFILSKNTGKAQKGHHTGVHSGDTIWVYIGNRNLIDIFRTIFHELVHHRQDQLGMIKHGDSYPGSPIEALADMMAGKYMKIYGQEHPDIFQ